MKIRVVFGALCSALVVTAALVASTGTAGATVPIPAFGGRDGGDVNCTSATACTGPGGTPYTGSVGACTTYPCVLNPNGTLDTDPAHHGGFGGHFYPGGGGLLGGGGLGLGGLNLLNGNTIVLGDNTNVNVCDYPRWTPFYQHFGGSQGGWLRAHALDELRYRQLVEQANCSSSLNGINLLNGNLIDLGGLGVLGGGTANVCQYNNWNGFNQFGLRRFGAHWGGFSGHYGGFLGGGGWNQLRLRAHCQPQIVVVPGSNTTTVVQAPPAPSTASPATPEAAPAPAPAPLTGSGNYHYPASAPDTGN